MIGLVLVTHGRLAAEFITAMEHVVGPQEAIEAICIGPDDDMEARRKDIAEAIAKVDQGQGVIILTDLFGGTPSNLAISLMKSENIEVIAGVNLPMLIRLEGARKVMGVHAAVAAAREAGRKYISRRLRDPRGSGGLTALSRDGPDHQQARPPRPGQRQVRQPRRALDADDRGREGRQPGVRHLDHGPDDARRGDGRHDHDPRRRATAPRQRARAARRAGRRRASAKTDALPRADHRLFQRDRQAAARAARQEGAARAKACSSPRGCASSPRRATAGVLPEIIASRPRARVHPLAAEIIAATEAAGGEVIETSADILAKMTRQGQSADDARRLSPARHRARPRSTAPPRRCGSSPRRCAIPAISAPSCAPATRSAPAG